ncbi:sodium-dependent phosphate transport protein 4 isoform 1 [Camelus ferus]|nr:sodium-dependent phosphate transport protein 4 isoform 1 [Camelus ferus]
MATMTELSPTEDKSKYSQDTQVDEKLSPRKAAQGIIMNITMVAMVNSTSHQFQFNGSTEALPFDSSGDPQNSPKSPTAWAPVYNWSPHIQGIIFSAISYGMILTLAPSGYLAGRVGTKRVVGVSLLGSSLLILFTPLATDLGLTFLIATRILQGLSQGSGLGGQFALWESWSPPHERSRLCSIALSGGVGCVFCLLWFVLVYDGPVTHPWINTTEKEYIMSSLAQQSGFLSALPFIIAWVVGILGGQLADFLLTKNFRLVTVRKIATVLGTLPSSAALVILPYITSSYIITVGLLTLACGLSPLCQSGIYINTLDLAPRHSSFLMGVSRGFAQIAAILAPTVSGFLLSQNPVYNWSPEIQGIILSSIFYGVLIAQIPAGYLSGIYSIKKMTGFALFFSSLFTLLIPLAAEFGEIWVIVCRVLQGISQGIAFTTQQIIWVKWAPPLEQGRLTTLSISGQTKYIISAHQGYA